MLRLALHDKKDALVAADEALQLGCSLGGVSLQGRSLLALGPEELTKVLREPTNVTLMYNYAVILDEGGREDEAKQILERIQQEVPQYYECELRLCKQLVRHKRWDDASTRLQQLCTDLESQLNAGVGVMAFSFPSS